MVSSEISEKNAKANAKTAIGNPFIRCLLVDNSPADIMVDDRIAKSFTNSLNPGFCSVPYHTDLRPGRTSQQPVCPATATNGCSFWRLTGCLFQVRSALMCSVMIKCRCGPSGLTAKKHLPILRQVKLGSIDHPLASRFPHVPNNFC